MFGMNYCDANLLPIRWNGRFGSEMFPVDITLDIMDYILMQEEEEILSYV